MWTEVFLFPVNSEREATTRTKEQKAVGGGSGGAAALLFKDKVVSVGAHSKWQMEVRAVKGLQGPWLLQWPLLQVW